jgi:site-specific DNA-methyltransferase (adenine-specific)
MDPKQGIPSLPDKSVDHILTDPPYSDHVHADNRRGWEDKTEGGKKKKRPTKPMPMRFDALSIDAVPEIASQMVRVTRGWILIFCALEQIGLWQASLVAAGAKRRNTIISTGHTPLDVERLRELIKILRNEGFTANEISRALRDEASALVWTKPNCAPKFAGDGPSNAAEAIVTAWAGTGMSKWNAGGGYGHYHFPVDNKAKERRHETQKPLPLIRQLILDFTNPNELVLDNYFGGGSTPIACKQLSRHWLGYEIDPKPYEAATKALEHFAPLNTMQQMMLHRKRKDRAYAGVRPKPTAIPIQTELLWVPEKKSEAAKSSKKKPEAAKKRGRKAG